MPRSEKAIDPSQGPIAEFALQLRHARDLAGKPPYRVMAERARYSHAHLVRAADGKKLPNWSVVRAYLEACGISGSKALKPWLQLWVATGKMPVATRPGNGRRRAGEARLHDLGAITTPAEFGEHLRAFCDRTKPRTLRELEELSGIGKTTLADWFNGARLPSWTRLYRLATLVGANQAELDELRMARERVAGNDEGNELAAALEEVLRTFDDVKTSEASRQVSAAMIRSDEARRINSGEINHWKMTGEWIRPTEGMNPHRQAATTWVEYQQERLAAASLAENLMPAKTTAKHRANAIDRQRARITEAMETEAKARAARWEAEQRLAKLVAEREELEAERAKLLREIEEHERALVARDTAEQDAYADEAAEQEALQLAVLEAEHRDAQLAELVEELEDQGVRISSEEVDAE
jgi:transcriptional regulator with XRE-family HTH domain